jgi:hypothetical protein
MRTIGLPEFLVIIGVFITVPIAALIVVYLIRSLQSKERQKAIEKGVAVPVSSVDPWERAARTRERGIVSIAIGLGLFTLLATTMGADGPSIGVGVGAIPCFIGLGLLLSYRLRVRDLRAGRPPQGTDLS